MEIYLVYEVTIVSNDSPILIHIDTFVSRDTLLLIISMLLPGYHQVYRHTFFLYPVLLRESSRNHVDG